MSKIVDQLDITLADKLCDVINEKNSNPMNGILHHEEGVDFIPANLELSTMEYNLMNALSRETTLKNYLSQVKRNYDYILIDCIAVGCFPLSHTLSPLYQLKQYTSR